jgi:hypothetical protein
MLERTNHTRTVSKYVADVAAMRGGTVASCPAVTIRVVDSAGGIWEGIGEDVARALHALRANASRSTPPHSTEYHGVSSGGYSGRRAIPCSRRR